MESCIYRTQKHGSANVRLRSWDAFLNDSLPLSFELALHLRKKKKILTTTESQSVRVCVCVPDSVYVCIIFFLPFC